MIVGLGYFYNVSYYCSFGAEINSPVLKGKVNAVNVDGIYVINLTTENR
jgi:hypothetical protein